MSSDLKRRKLDAILKGSTRDAPTVRRSQLCLRGLPVVFGCTTSREEDFSPSGSGLFLTESDTAMINYIHFKGEISLTQNEVQQDNSDHQIESDACIRHIVVYYNQWEVEPGGTGALPKVPQVLENYLTIDNPQGPYGMNSFPWNSSFNAGKFSILHDKTHHLGRRDVLMSTSRHYYDNQGPGSITLDLKLKVNRPVQFKAPGTIAYPGGHNDQAVTAGRVSKGLVVSYFIANSIRGAATVQTITQLNYTA
jgi:hypothetical protein